MPPDDPCSYNSRMRGASNSVVSREKSTPRRASSKSCLSAPIGLRFRNLSSSKSGLNWSVISWISSDLQRSVNQAWGVSPLTSTSSISPIVPTWLPITREAPAALITRLSSISLCVWRGKSKQLFFREKIMKQSLSVSGVLSRSISICRTFKRVPVTKLNNSHNSQKNTKFTNTYILYIKPVMNS